MDNFGKHDCKRIGGSGAEFGEKKMPIRPAILVIYFNIFINKSIIKVGFRLG